VLFQLYQTFEPGLALCKEISRGTHRQFCFRGIFMEYSDELLDTSLVNETSVLSYPDPSNPLSMCDQEEMEQRRPCLQFFPRIAAYMIEAEQYTASSSASRIRRACESMHDAETRSACFVGFGHRYGTLIVDDPPAAASRCESLKWPSDQRSCIFGSMFFTLQHKKYKEVFSACETFARRSIQQDCSFYLVDELRHSVQGAARECPTESAFCLKAAENHEESPWLIALDNA
jgi:hypothetical protein